MVDYLRSGITPLKNSKEPTYFDMATSGGQISITNQLNDVRNQASGYFTPVKKTPSEFNNIYNIDTLRGVLPLKSGVDAITFGRTEHSLTEHMYPKTSYARNQPRGLATNHNKEFDAPIMPIAGFYNPDAPNVLGGLK